MHSCSRTASPFRLPSIGADKLDEVSSRRIRSEWPAAINSSALRCLLLLV